MHAGWYAISDEAYYTSTQVEKFIDPVTGTIKQVGNLFLVYLVLMVYLQIARETGKEVVWTEEENYKFRLSSFRPALKKWIKASLREFFLKFLDAISNVW